MLRKLLTWVNGSLRVKMLLLMAGVLVPLLAIYGVFQWTQSWRAFERAELQKAETLAITGAKTIGYVLEEAIASGQLTRDQVFDINYQPIPDTNPQKYHTAYDAFTDVHFPQLIDAYLNDTDVLYAAALDVNGYAPTHNTRFAQPLTGDYQIDLARNRTKRIYTDPVAVAATQNTQPLLFQSYVRDTGEIAWDISSPIYVKGQHWGAFRVGISVADLTAQRNTLGQTALIATVALIIIVFGVLALAIRTVTRPLAALNQAVSRVAGGDFKQVVAIPSEDEIGALATTFNTMVRRLEASQTELTERNRALAASAEVSRRLSTVLDEAQLVREVVEQLQQAFGFYHAHIYLFDAQRENLVMAGGTGPAGAALMARGHTLKPGRGLVGRAAATNTAIVAPDAALDPDWLPNPLLPDTRAEIAVPIAQGAEVLGVLDVQHNVVNGLKAPEAELLQAIANQVAIALQNARSYRRTQNAAERAALLNSVSRKIQTATTLEAVLEVATRELGQALNARAARAEVSLAPPSERSAVREVSA